MSTKDTGDRPHGNTRTEIVPDTLRQLLVVLVTKAWAEIRNDPEMTAPRGELEDLMRLISGSDVQLRSVRLRGPPRSGDR